MIQALWNAEPVLLAILGSVAFWPALYAVCAAFNHPLTDAQQHALTGLGTVLAALIARSKVTAPDTLQQIKNANQSSQGV